MFSGFAANPEKLGLFYSGATRADTVRFLVDETWVDAIDKRIIQEVTDRTSKIIDSQEEVEGYPK